MDKQMSLPYLSDELAQVRTKKEYLTQIEQIIPWENGKPSFGRTTTKESVATSPTH